MAVGSDGLGLIEFDDYELARRIGIIALALILFEGGLTSGLLEIRPVLAPALSLAIVGTIITAVVTGLAAAWLFDLSTLDGMLLGSILAAPTARRSSRCCAARRSSAAWPPRWRANRGSTTRSPCCSCSASSSGCSTTTTGWRHGRALRAPDRHRLAVGVVVGVAAVWALRRVTLATAGLYPVATLAVAALAFGARTPCTARASWPSTWPGWRWAGRHPRPADDHLLPPGPGLAGRRWRCSSRWACSSSRAGSTTSPCAGRCWRSCSSSSRGRWRVASPPCRRGSPGASGRSRRAGLRGAVPVVLATFPVIAGRRRAAPSSSTSSSSRCCSRRSSRARPSSRWRERWA